LRAQILQTKGVTKRFGALIAVDQVDYSLREHEVAAIIAPTAPARPPSSTC
jgi:ABC-type branched-subunit amino acid transport system ATPase component